MVAYSPFGSPDLPWGEKMPHILVDPVLKRIGEKHQRSTANVVLRWLLQRGLIAIPKVQHQYYQSFLGGECTKPISCTVTKHIKLICYVIFRVSSTVSLLRT